MYDGMHDGMRRASEVGVAALAAAVLYLAAVLPTAGVRLFPALATGALLFASMYCLVLASKVPRPPPSAPLCGARGLPREGFGPAALQPHPRGTAGLVTPAVRAAYNKAIDKPARRSADGSLYVYPARVSLREGMFRPRNQIGGTCTAFATASVMEFHAKRKQDIQYRLSPFYIHGNRWRDPTNNDTPSDALVVETAGVVAMSYGACPEFLMPSTAQPNLGAPNFATPYYTVLDRFAAPFKIARYEFIFKVDLSAAKAHIAAGRPIVVCLPCIVATDFWAISPDLSPTDESIPRHHAVVFDGYDDVKQAFSLRNSWGTDWGALGYKDFPYADWRVVVEFLVLYPVENPPAALPGVPPEAAAPVPKPFPWDRGNRCSDLWFQPNTRYGVPNNGSRLIRGISEEACGKELVKSDINNEAAMYADYSGNRNACYLVNRQRVDSAGLPYDCYLQPGNRTQTGPLARGWSFLRRTAIDPLWNQQQFLT